MTRILLIGAGKLGSRYLQGLVALEDHLDITVVDPSEDSLAIAHERLAEVSSAFKHEVVFRKSIDYAPQYLDLALVVTPAHCRARLVEELASRKEVKAWILEKLLAQNVVQLDQINQALAGNSQVWVNTNRRLMTWHNEIRFQLQPHCKVPIKVNITGDSWDMATNAIHFIDLVSWWLDTSVVHINTKGLGHWTPSKRAGFYEVFGRMHVTYSDRSELELTCLPGPYTPIQISVSTPQGEWLIEDEAGRAVGPSGQQLLGELSLFSDLTAPLVKQILKEGRCDLPTLVESTEQHRHFLAALLVHWNISHSCQNSILPIT